MIFAACIWPNQMLFVVHDSVGGSSRVRLSVKYYLTSYDQSGKGCQENEFFTTVISRNRVFCFLF